MRKAIRKIAAVLCVAVTVVMGGVFYYGHSLPSEFYSHDGSLYINSLVSIDSKQSGAMKASGEIATSRNVSLKLFGAIPIKQTHLSVVKQKVLVPCGTPFGIKLCTDGVLVVGVGDIKTQNGTICPAREAGIKIGDAITSINNRTVLTNEDIEGIVAESKGSVFVSVRRDNKLQTVKLNPAVDENSGKKIGLWVRDSTAGIGTITFYDPASHTFGGLGHPICDVDTGDVMPLLSGEVVNVRINDVVKGESGEPGELKGSFTSQNACGTVTSNNETGIYGTLNKNPSKNIAIPVALKQQIKPGDAQMYTTILGTEPKAYNIQIESINLSDSNKTKNMVIRVTDQELLNKTGGIVQGMSGSPIIQNGKIVGAVTHVLVNNPQKGYAIFIENMYDNLKE